MEIREGGLDDPQVIALLRLHAEGMLANSPPGSCHFLDLSGLKVPEVTFWSGWDGDALVVIGALKALSGTEGEIKSMRTAPAALRRGAGAAMLAHIVAEAQARGYARLSLETGSAPAFDAAIALYRRFGFAECGPFGDYRPDPFSRFLTRAL
ncbi:GNAT family N-acetyltransferase [Sphingomonas hengshuiensis]|uniref:Acetyltransferase n=1 Tax=Sphingomonas hengshuiensis TaxID=1609977 RepID=A0A7U4JBU3_9SPHN|nr:GNAT family N-acetyltransferase [Sphingomonas hengshuiensis]AJP73946.1 acetyltransferase [Sphingomonas hengshuiensis]